MLRCSSDFLYTATISNCPGKLFEADMDSYVLSKLQSILCDFFNILQTKQKFQILCQEPKFSSICNWYIVPHDIITRIIQYMITPFYQSILNDRVSFSSLLFIFRSTLKIVANTWRLWLLSSVFILYPLHSFIDLGLFLNHQFPALYFIFLFSFYSLVMLPLLSLSIPLLLLHFLSTYILLYPTLSLAHGRLSSPWCWIDPSLFHPSHFPHTSILLLFASFSRPFWLLRILSVIVPSSLGSGPPICSISPLSSLLSKWESNSSLHVTSTCSLKSFILFMMLFLYPLFLFVYG